MSSEDPVEQAVAAVERKRAGASNFGVIREIAEFLDGTLYTVGFTSSEGKKLQNHVYMHDGHIEVYSWDYELLQAIAKQRRTALERLLQLGGIAGAIAVSLTITICLMIYHERTVPDILENALTIILGFYFGTQVRRS